MKCLRKNKNCEPSLCIRGAGKNFVCAGLNKKPSKFKKDNIWLCLSGELSNRTIEMTKQEAGFFIGCLGIAIGESEPTVGKQK